MKNFATLQEILEVYSISRKLVREILRDYRVDCYKKDDELYINFKEFHKVYTTKYNPSLFSLEEKQEEKKKQTNENNLNRTFFNIFSEPVNHRQKKLRRISIAYAW